MAKKKNVEKETLHLFLRCIKNLLAGFVPVEDGKSLSTNDYSNDDKQRLDSLQPSTLHAAGNWIFRLQGETFEAWYQATGQKLIITNQSGNLYRSTLMSLTLPQELADGVNIHIKHAEVNAAHNNYPSWGLLASLNGSTINYYAMSGSSRSESPNYTVTAYAMGTIVKD